MAQAPYDPYNYDGDNPDKGPYDPSQPAPTENWYPQDKVDYSKTCPPGYEWENDGTTTGRCKVKGTKWEDQCWIHPDTGITYCNGDGPNKTKATEDQTTPTSTVPRAAAPSAYTGLNNEILDKYRSMFGKRIPGPYTPERIAELEGKAKAISESSKATAKQSYMAQRSAMGLGKSGRTNQGLRNISMTADQQLAQNAIGINDTAIKTNYQAEIANVERDLSILNSQAQYAIALASNETQRQSIQNSYSLQILQLQQRLEELKLQYIMGQ